MGNKSTHQNFQIFLAFLTIICISCTSLTLAATPCPTAFIKKECDATSYPQLCYSKFSRMAAKIKNNRQRLCQAALKVTLDAAQETSKVLSKTSKEYCGVKPNTSEAVAIRDCFEETDDTIDEIKQCLNEIKSDWEGSNRAAYVRSNLKTWLSAAITDENTCLDGLDEGHVRDYLKKKISDSVLGVLKLTSITLSLINRL